MSKVDKFLKLFTPKRILGYGFTFICFLLCAYILTEYIKSTVESRPPKLFTYSISYVPTQSMEPNIHAGEYVIFQTTDFDSISAGTKENQFDGDIVIYKNKDGIYVIHRVIEKYDDYMIVQGDNNPVPDFERVTKSNLYGKYLGKVDFLTKVFSEGIDKGTIFIILFVIFASVIIVQIISIFIKAQTDSVKKQKELVKKITIEEAKKQILAEELERIRKEKQNKNENKS